MKKKHRRGKTAGKEHTLLQSFFIAFLVSAVVSFLLLLLLACLLEHGLPEEIWIRAGVIVIYVIACFIGGFLVGKQQKHRRLLWGLLFGSGYFLLLMVVSLLMGNAAFHVPAAVITAAALCVGAGGLGGVCS